MSLRALVPPALILIAAALGAAACSSGSAPASPASPASSSSPASPASPASGQLTGTRLGSALLPAADFDQSAQAGSQVSSGSQPMDKQATDHIATMSCVTLLGATSANSAFGQTAYAGDTVTVTSGPAFGVTYRQFVLQFARPSAATAVYTQLTARYARCVSLTRRATVNHILVSETIHAVSNVLAGGHQAVAIIVSETAYLPTGRGITKTSDLIVAVDGVDVLTIARVALGSPQAPTALAVKLIARVQALT